MEGQDELKAELFSFVKSRAGDAKCADCGSVSPEWASVSLGVFICVECSGVHRMMGTHVSRVKSVRLDKWKPTELAHMRETGNKASNACSLARVQTLPLSLFFRGPKLAEDGAEMREQWIRCKYERRELNASGPFSPLLAVLEQPVPLLEGWIVKRGAKRKSWKKRWCELLGTRLTYFAKRNDGTPKGSVGIREVAGIEVVKAEMEGQQHVLRLIIGDRSFFMALEDAETTMRWLCVLRSIRARLVDGTGGSRKAASQSAAELVGRARAELVLRTRKGGKGAASGDGFLGCQLVDWLMVSQELETRDDALAVANEMLAMRAFRHRQLDLSSVLDSDDVYVWNK